MELAPHLTVAPTSLTYFNELSRGGSTYAFAWDGQKRAWHLHHVEATRVENGVSGIIVSKAVLDYPGTLSPKVIRDALRTHRSVVH